jgi:hypothetical protein
MATPDWAKAALLANTLKAAKTARADCCGRNTGIHESLKN